MRTSIAPGAFIALCTVMSACGGGSGGGNASASGGGLPDAGAAADAGSVVDAGGTADAGSAVDGGSAVDAGAVYPGAGTAKIEWGPDTTYVDASHLGLLLSSDDAQHVYTFDTAAAAAAALDLSVGRILVIHRKAMRRISESQTVGANTVVTTDFVSLDQAAKEADIQIAEPITFTAEHLRPQLIDENGQIRTGLRVAATDASYTYKFKMESYDVEMKLAPKGDSMGVELAVSKKGGGFESKFTAAGAIEKTVFKEHVVIHDGHLASYSHSNEGLKGDLKLTLASTGPGKDDINFKPSITFLEVPDMIGPIPVSIKMSIQVVVKLVMPLDGSSVVETGFKFDSDSGVHYDGTSFSYDSGLVSADLTKGTVHTGASSPIGINWGFNFPILGMSMFGELAGISVKPGFLIGGSFTPFFPPCQTADAEFLVSAGGDLKLFSLLTLEYSKTLAEKKVELLRAGNCPK